MKKIQKKRLVPILILIIILALALILINNRDKAVVGKVYYDDSGWECEGDKCRCIFQGCAYNGEVMKIGSTIPNLGNDPGMTAQLSTTEEKCGWLCKFVNLLIGNKEARAGKSWFDREAVVGKVGGNEGFRQEVEAEQEQEEEGWGQLGFDCGNSVATDDECTTQQFTLCGFTDADCHAIFNREKLRGRQEYQESQQSQAEGSENENLNNEYNTEYVEESGRTCARDGMSREECERVLEVTCSNNPGCKGSYLQGWDEVHGATTTQPEPEEDAWPPTTTTTATEEIDTEEGNTRIRLYDNSITETTTEIANIMREQCGDLNENGCVIRSSNTFIIQEGEREYEYIIKPNSLIIRRNTASDERIIYQSNTNFEPISLSKNQYDKLVNDEDSLRPDENGNLIIGSGENQRTISQNDWGLEVKQGENIYYIVGDVEIKEDGDGNWIYREEEYENEPEVDANSLTLSNDDNSIVISRQESTGRIQIVETDTDSPRDSTTTILLEDGGKIVEKIEGGKLDERERLDSEGRTVWEDQVDNEGNFQGRYWYFVPVSSENEEDNSFPSFCDNGGCVGWCREDTCEKPDNYFNIQECGYDDGAYSNCYQYTPTEEFRERNYQEQLWTGNIGQWDSNAWQDFLVGSNAFFGHSVSAYPLANVWEGYKNYMEDVDEFFATHYLGVDYWTSEICRAEPSVSPNEGIGFIETISGDRQSVAYVVAEKIPVGGMLCDPEGKCPNELTCRRDQFCYEGNSDEPEEGYLYRIDWKVTAPRDEEAIVYTGGARQGEINFNLKVFGERESFLFSDAYGIQDENVITLKKGENSATNYTSLIVEYSTLNFNKICIEWGNNKPQTRDYTFGADFKPLKDVCNDIIEAQPMLVQQSPNNPGVASRSSTGVTYC